MQIRIVNQKFARSHNTQQTSHRLSSAELVYKSKTQLDKAFDNFPRGITK